MLVTHPPRLPHAPSNSTLAYAYTVPLTAAFRSRGSPCRPDASYATATRSSADRLPRDRLPFDFERPPRQGKGSSATELLAGGATGVIKHPACRRGTLSSGVSDSSPSRPLRTSLPFLSETKSTLCRSSDETQGRTRKMPLDRPPMWQNCRPTSPLKLPIQRGPDGCRVARSTASQFICVEFDRDREQAVINTLDGLS